MGGQHQVEVVISWSAHVLPYTPSGPRAPTKSTLRSGLVPSTPKPGAGARSRPGSGVAPPRAAAPPAFGRGCGSRKPRSRSSELRSARRAGTAPQTQPAHPEDPSDRPSKRGLDPNLRHLYTDGVDRTGIAERGPRDHGDPGRASSGEQAGSPSLRSERQELLGP